MPRCSECTSKPFCPKPCKEALCGETPPRGTVNEQGAGRVHLAGEALLIMPGGVESPLSLLVVWGRSAPQLAENRAAPSADCLPSRSFSPPIWGFGVRRDTAGAANWYLPQNLLIRFGDYTKEVRR